MEKKADSYSDPISTEVKMKVQNDFETKLLRVQDFVHNVQKIITTTQNLLKSNGPLTPLSLFDVMSQINENAMNQLPDFSNSHIEYSGQFEIDTDLLADNCKAFSFIIAADSKSEIGEIKYKMKSCQTNGEYFELINVALDRKSVQFKVVEKNLGLIFPTKIFAKQIPSCEFSKKQKQTSNCQNIVLAHANDLIWTSNISIGDKIRIEFKGLSKESGALVYKGLIILSQSGKLENSDIQGPFTQEN